MYFRCKCPNGFVSGTPSYNLGKSTIDAIHRPIMFAICAVGASGELLRERLIMCAESDLDLSKKSCAKKFVNYLLEEESYFKSLLQTDFSKPATDADYDKFYSDTSCNICEVILSTYVVFCLYFYPFHL